MKNLLGFGILISIVAVASWAAVNSQSTECSAENVKPLLSLHQKVLQEHNYSFDYNSLITYKVSDTVEQGGFYNGSVPLDAKVCIIELKNGDGKVEDFPYALWKTKKGIMTKFIVE